MACPRRSAAARRARRARASPISSASCSRFCGDPPLEPEVGESSRGRRARAGTARPRRAAHSVRHVTDQQRGVRGVELQLPGQRKVGGPAMLAEQVQSRSGSIRAPAGRRPAHGPCAPHAVLPRRTGCVRRRRPAPGRRCRRGARPRTADRRPSVASRRPMPQVRLRAWSSADSPSRAASATRSWLNR